MSSVEKKEEMKAASAVVLLLVVPLGQMWTYSQAQPRIGTVRVIIQTVM